MKTTTKQHNYKTDEEYYLHHPSQRPFERHPLNGFETRAKEKALQADKVAQIGDWLTMNRPSLSTWVNETGMFGEGIRAIYPSQPENAAYAYQSKASVMTILMEDGSEFVISIQQSK